MKPSARKRSSTARKRTTAKVTTPGTTKHAKAPKRGRAAKVQPAVEAMGAPLIVANLPKTKKDQSPDELQRTRDWYRAARDALTPVEDAVEEAFETALPGSVEETRLLDLKGSLRDRRTTLDQEEESFLAENSEVALRPPSQADIDKTKQLATDLGARIAKEKTAQAVLGLLNDLAGLAPKFSA